MSLKTLGRRNLRVDYTLKPQVHKHFLRSEDTSANCQENNENDSSNYLPSKVISLRINSKQNIIKQDIGRQFYLFKHLMILNLITET